MTRDSRRFSASRWLTTRHQGCCIFFLGVATAANIGKQQQPLSDSRSMHRVQLEITSGLFKSQVQYLKTGNGREQTHLESFM